MINLEGIPKSKKYGSFTDLSNKTEESINELIKKLDEKQIVYNIYYGYPVIDEKQNKDYVKGIIISAKGIFVLYENEREQDAFASRVVQLISQDMELFSAIRKIDYLKEMDLNNTQAIIDIYEDSVDIFDTAIVEKANRAIQTAYGLSKYDDRSITNPNTLGAKIKSRNTFIGTFDEDQFNMIHSYDTNNLRIRGLAGSGKTILLVKKMAYLHYKFPDKNLAFVFYTVSLKQYIFDLFKKYYKDYDRYGEPNLNKIQISHGWGSNYRKGFYSEVCNKVGNVPKNFNDAREKKGSDEDAFEFVCKDLLEFINTSITPTQFYDYIFVDEAQDFKLNFFRLARKSLTSSGKLIYAYDELQSLNDEKPMPTKTEIFGDEECIDINLTTSYRAPVEILTTAHALGLGMYREVSEGEIPFVNILRDKEVWIDIGYHVEEGRLEYGERVVLTRKEKKLADKKLITTAHYDNEEQQYKELSEIIINLLKNEDIIPEDILIIDLSYKLSDNHSKFRMIFNKHAREAELFLPGSDRLSATINLVNKDNPTRMKVENAIPYTTIFRAKGNEANLVFIVNGDSLEMLKSISRNKIFTAMTRARYSVWLMGMKQIKSFEKEIQEVERKNYVLDFTYPTVTEMEKIKTYGELESVNERKMSNVVNEISELSKANPELAKKLLQDMLKELGDE
jgi:superfamily I DNA and RNA helicase